MNIRDQITREVRQLRECECQLPPAVRDLLVGGQCLLRFDDETLVREWELYGELPALMFMAAWVSGLTPRELNIKSVSPTTERH